MTTVKKRLTTDFFADYKAVDYKRLVMLVALIFLTPQILENATAVSKC